MDKLIVTPNPHPGLGSSLLSIVKIDLEYQYGKFHFLVSEDCCLRTEKCHQDVG